ncbi:transcriptional regulator [Burkholderia cepacia]|uniref:dimethylsulfonioproprionate lyase family protein n=1 Tax=Burkholderia cepacia TaxID=292 RepID=UPI0007590BE5|nr:dimethylsulfonioproprionate lyase family protein [Burkholderia cepacia]KWF91858.1 transcriptional regulator [Burkholderia cepacia]
MIHRSSNVSAFIEIAERLFRSTALPSAGRAVAAKVFERLRVPSDDGVRHDTRYPACSLLDATLVDVIGEQSDMGAAARALKAIEPELGWSRRSSGSCGSDGYIKNHVHGMICGPGGAESRYDVQLGFSLLAPNTRYPDHHHPPEEAYVLFTPGEFRQTNGAWFDPGLGGGIHNAPHSVHAMRSGSKPFLAVWSLLT